MKKATTAHYMSPLDMETVDRDNCDEIYGFLESEGILLENKKGWRRESKGTGDQLYMDKMLLQEEKRRKKNLAMGWTDYWKAYDMVLHSWVRDSLNVMDIVKNVVLFWGKKGEVLESGAKLWCRDSRGSTYKERNFSRGCLHTYDTHTESSKS